MRGGAASAAIFVVLVLGSWGVLAPAAARAAIEPEVLEAVEAPEVRQVATDVAALLESIPADSEEQVFSAALHRYLADSVYEDQVLEDALAVVLTGTWSDTQAAALRSIYSIYATADVNAPGGGVDTQASRASAASRGFAELQTAPGGGVTVQSLSTADGEEDGDFTEPPPLTSGGGGTSDYRP